MGLIPRNLRESLDRLKASEPGERFQDRYRERHRQQQSGGSATLRRWLYLGGGSIVILAGLFFLAAPGPGFLVLFIGGGLVAQESLVAARVLDWVEVRLRKVGSWALGVWKQSSVPVRALIVLVAVGCAGAAGYAAYMLMFER